MFRLIASIWTRVGPIDAVTARLWFFWGGTLFLWCWDWDSLCNGTARWSRDHLRAVWTALLTVLTLAGPWVFLFGYRTSQVEAWDDGGFGSELALQTSIPLLEMFRLGDLTPSICILIPIFLLPWTHRRSDRRLWFFLGGTLGFVLAVGHGSRPDLDLSVGERRLDGGPRFIGFRQSHQWMVSLAESVGRLLVFDWGRLGWIGRHVYRQTIACPWNRMGDGLGLGRWFDLSFLAHGPLAHGGWQIPAGHPARHWPILKGREPYWTYPCFSANRPVSVTKSSS